MHRIFSVLCCITFSGALWATSPCTSIFIACKQAGYYQGGSTVGKGLISNCMIPVVNRQMQLPETNFDESNLTQCKSQLREIISKQ